MNKSPTVYSRISTAASSRQGTNKVSWSTHSRKILFLAFLVVVPIIAFTITIISIVFVNSIDLNDCPDRDLCPYTNTTPGPANSSDYYVDFSVGRLAFVSSLSSTISFALVAAMMSLYGYVVAKQMMHASKEPGSQANLPTPYGASTLIRLLNAETFLLGEMLLSGCRKVLTRKRVQRKPSKQPQLLRMCMSVLLLSLTASILIQVADTYLHIVVEAISVTRLSLETNNTHQLSRELGSWLYDPGEFGGSRYFFSPVLEVTKEGVGVSNLTLYVDTVDKVENYMRNYTDTNGVTYALVSPPGVDPNLDWSGTGYGVSTQCSAIPRDSCEISRANRTAIGAQFKCESSSPPINITGKFGEFSHMLYVYNWHKYMKEPPPFSDSAPYGNSTFGIANTKVNKDLVSNLTWETSSSLFQNPWNFLSKIQILAYYEDMPEAFQKSPLHITEFPGSQIFLLACNTTVYDTNYTVVNGQVSSLSAKKSEGAVAGMVSMMSLESVRKMTTGKNKVITQANNNITTPEAFIKEYEYSISKQMSVPLIVHTEPSPATLTQLRKASVITRLPKVALWLLVVANLIFALLGCILALLALRATSPEVHQVHVRLSTAGLAAQLFDPQHARCEGKNDAALFREKNRDEKMGLEKRVGIRRTVHGGAEFVAHDTSDYTSMEAGGEGLALRHTRTL